MDSAVDSPEVVFLLQGVNDLHDNLAEGVWQDELHFHENVHERCVYHYHLNGPKPYAKVYVNCNEPNIIRCDYQIGQEVRISCTRNIINLLGLESFLLQRDGLLLHSSLIQWNGRGLLFTAPSGTGKSTQAELWNRYEGADILNGDRAALMRRDNCWTAWGLPFAGTSGIYRNDSTPVSAIVILRQGVQNKIRSLSLGEAIRYIYPELTVHRWDADFSDRVLTLLIELVSSVPVYYLECLPDESAVCLLKDSIRKVE